MINQMDCKQNCKHYWRHRGHWRIQNHWKTRIPSICKGYGSNRGFYSHLHLINRIFEYLDLLLRHRGMENKLSSIKLVVIAVVSSLLMVNCTTTYDAQGLPVQSIDPVAATAAVVAVGAIAYAVGQNNGSDYRRGRYARGRRGFY